MDLLFIRRVFILDFRRDFACFNNRVLNTSKDTRPLAEHKSVRNNVRELFVKKLEIKGFDPFGTIPFRLWLKFWVNSICRKIPVIPIMGLNLFPEEDNEPR